MKTFKQFIKESNLEVPNSEPMMSSPPNIGLGNIFTSAAGYKQKRPEEYNPAHSAMVHKTSHFPLGGEIQTLGSLSHIARETLHFTRNGTVGSHIWGNWDSSKYGIMIPEDHISKKLVGIGDHDSFTYGNIKLPTGTKITMNWDALEPHERDHITALTKSSSHDETLTKLRAESEDGTRGHSVNFNGRNITLSAMSETEKTVDDAVHSHLRHSGISPVTIGNNYAVGPLDRNIPNESYFDEKERNDEFRKHYNPIGTISTYYRKNAPPIISPVPTKNIEMSNLRTGMSEPKGAGHAQTIHSNVEAIVSKEFALHPQGSMHPDFKHMSTIERMSLNNYRHDPKEMRQLITIFKQTISSPETFHKTAYRTPEERSAIARQISKLTLAVDGKSATTAGPSLEEAKDNRKTAMIKETRRLSTEKTTP